MELIVGHIRKNMCNTLKALNAPLFIVANFNFGNLKRSWMDSISESSIFVVNTAAKLAV